MGPHGKLGQEAAGAGGEMGPRAFTGFCRTEQVGQDEQAEAWLVWITSGALGHWRCPWLSGLTRAGGPWP